MAASQQGVICALLATAELHGLPGTVVCEVATREPESVGRGSSLSPRGSYVNVVDRVADCVSTPCAQPGGKWTTAMD